MNSLDHILVVDDNPINLKLMRVLLESEGYAVRTATTAKEAWDAVHDSKPDLVLMDVQLPGESGLELTARLRSDPLTSELCIVAITAYAMANDRERALDAGCDGYIAKPIDTRTFNKTIRAHLDRRGS